MTGRDIGLRSGSRLGVPEPMRGRLATGVKNAISICSQEDERFELQHVDPS